MQRHFVNSVAELFVSKRIGNDCSELIWRGRFLGQRKNEQRNLLTARIGIVEIEQFPSAVVRALQPGQFVRFVRPRCCETI